jgi:hypothetical protein
MIKYHSEEFDAGLPAKACDMKTFPPLHHCILLLLHFMLFIGAAF